jgi:hypothetical protein
MRIVRNVGHVNQKKRIARLSAFFGFLMLASTFALIFFPGYVAGAYVLLIIGFVLFNYGMQQLGKWSNTPRHVRDDLALDAQLNPFSDKFVMMHYVQIGKKIVEHLLISPSGIVVVSTRDLPGVVTVEGKRWRKKSGGLTRFFMFSGPQLGSPSADLDRDIKMVIDALEAAMLEVDVFGAVVFTSQAIELDAQDTEYPTMKLDHFADFVRTLPVDPTFKTNERDALVARFGGGAKLEETKPASVRRPVKVKRRAAPVAPSRSER